jgi:hypothetical protein
MSDFKLLAIRPLKGCSPKYRKNLKEGEFYTFYNEYTFSEIIGKVEIKHNKEFSTDNLYKLTPSKGSPKINISAIVGANGSGKSTLIELFFLSIYLSNYKHLINKRLITLNKNIESLGLNECKNYNDFEKKLSEINLSHLFLMNEKENETENENFKQKKYLSERIIEETKPIKTLTNEKVLFEVYFLINEEINGFRFDSNNVNDLNFYSQFLGSFNLNSFYTIALNYSIHGLNSNVNYLTWIESLFHKNDSYKTPLVINPKRIEGNIDINNELTLQKQRMISNLIYETHLQENYSLLNHKKINSISVNINQNKACNYLGNGIISLSQFEENGIELFNSIDKSIQEPEVFELFKKICSKLNPKKQNVENLLYIEIVTLHYLAKKIIDNLKKYHNKEEVNIDDKLLDQILDNKSHEGFKIQQCINFINHDSQLKTIFDNSNFGTTNKKVNKIDNSECFYFKKSNEGFKDLDVLNLLCLSTSNEIYDLILSNPENIIYHLLPPIFDYDLFFSENENDSLNNLSSGEKQQLYSIHTICYHIRNIASKEKKSISKYNYINLLLDEIELYFHPEMQQSFIKKLLENIKQMKLSSKDIKGINILFATHSPFILSDIPAQNILRLENGYPMKFESENRTFAANIHKLLHDDFFMRKGFMGEFAKNKINDVILQINIEETNLKIINLKKEILVISDKDKETQLQSEINELERFINKNKNKIPFDQNSLNKIIDLIGEPIIKEQLRAQMLRIDILKKGSENAVRSEIERLADKYNIEINFPNQNN